MCREAEPGIDCAECEYQNECRHKRPSLSIDNEDVFEIIYFSPSIWLRDFNGLVGFNWGEVRHIMDILEVSGSRGLFSKLQKAEELMLTYLRDKADAG